MSLLAVCLALPALAGAGCGRDSLRRTPTGGTLDGSPGTDAPGGDGSRDRIPDGGGPDGLGGPDGPAPTIVSISVDPPMATLVVGSSRALVVTAIYSDGTHGDVTASALWSSDTTSVAIVLATPSAGVVTAVTSGMATITATVGSLTASAAINVTAATVVGIAVLPGAPVTAIGTTVSFTASATLSDGTSQDLTTSATWSSSNLAVATVAPAGISSALGAGTATITASFGGLSGTALLTVTAATLATLQVDPMDPTVGIGVAIAFQATGIYSDGTRADLTAMAAWSSSNLAAVTIDGGGNAATHARGTSVITAAFGGKTATSTVTVKAAALTSIAISPPTATLMVGGTAVLRAIGTYADGSTVDLTTTALWSATPAGVVSVSNAAATAGNVTALAVGAAMVSATSGVISGTAVITVSAATLLAIIVSPAVGSIPAGTTLGLTAVGVFSDTTSRDVTTQVAWSSSADAVATVSNLTGQNGQVTGVSAGTATIFARLTGVVGSASITVTGVTLSSIAVTPDGATTTVGLRSNYTATGTYSDGSTADLTGQVSWSTDDATVATISNVAGAQGQLLARAAGMTAVMAVLGGVVGSANVTVVARVTVALSISPIAGSTRLGTNVQFAAIEIFSDGTQQNVTAPAAWTSSNTAVATIGGRGVARPVAVGLTTITATYMGLTASTTLTVTDAVVTSLEITPVAPIIPLGTVVAFTAEAIYSDGTSQNVTAATTWTSSAPGVLAVTTAGLARGRGTAIAAGGATVTATFMGVAGSTVATVTNAVAVQISVSPAGLTLPVGARRQFTAQEIFSDGTSQDVTARATWTSDLPSVAGVSDVAATRGLVTTVSAGSADIQAAFAGLSQSVPLTVSAATLTAIQVTPFDETVPVGTPVQFEATGIFSDGTSASLTATVAWQSSDPTVAAVSNAAGTRGLTSTLATGMVTISATTGGLTGSTSLTISAATLMAIQVTPFNPAIPAGFSQQLVATGLYSDGTNRDITRAATWTSGNAAAATVSDALASKGFVAAVAAGTASIVAQFSGQSGSTVVSVSSANLTSIAIAPANPAALAGATVAFTASGNFDDGTVLDITTFVTWTSSDTQVADVSNADGSRGQATAFAPGSATIQAQHGAITATTTLTVN